MTELGYKLSSEEHGPQELVRNAARAEEAGFTFGLISDHFHPWIDRQGESPFVCASMLPGKFFLGVGSGENLNEHVLGRSVTWAMPPITDQVGNRRNVPDDPDSSRDNRPGRGHLHVCYGDDEAKMRKVAHEWWPNIAIQGELGQELPAPAHFEQAAEMVSEDDVAEVVACGPDPEAHMQVINKYVDVGYEHLVVHQIGPDQEGFFNFYEEEILPTFS